MSYLYGSNVIKDKILTNVSAAIREVRREIKFSKMSHRFFSVQIHRFAADEKEQTAPILTNSDWQVHCLLEHLDFALLFGYEKQNESIQQQ